MHKGMGLFTYDHIHQHSTIDHYLGEVSNSPIYGQYVLQGGTRHSPIWLDGNPALRPTLINGVPVGQQGSARAAYANEPWPGEWANAKLVRTPFGAKIVAIRPGGIPPCSEILICYGKEYDRHYPHNHKRSRCYDTQTPAALRSRERQIAARNGKHERHPVAAATGTGHPESDTDDLEWHTCLSHGSDIDHGSLTVASVTEYQHTSKVKRLRKVDIVAMERRRLLRISRRKWSRDTASRDLAPCDPMSQDPASGDPQLCVQTHLSICHHPTVPSHC
jgi:hypothetical protein